jgi:hypothetical protein
MWSERRKSPELWSLTQISHILSGADSFKLNFSAIFKQKKTYGHSQDLAVVVITGNGWLLLLINRFQDKFFIFYSRVWRKTSTPHFKRFPDFTNLIEKSPNNLAKLQADFHERKLGLLQRTN